MCRGKICPPVGKEGRIDGWRGAMSATRGGENEEKDGSSASEQSTWSKPQSPVDAQFIALKFSILE
jgi:hypothetical protein